DSQVGVAVAVEVGRHQEARVAGGVAGRGEGRRGCAGGGAVEQDGDVVAAVVAGGDVRLAVLVEVGGDHPLGVAADGHVGAREAACAVGQEHAAGVRAVVGGDEVGVAVAVEVARGRGEGPAAGAEGGLAGERAGRDVAGAANRGGRGDGVVAAVLDGVGGKVGEGEVRLVDRQGVAGAVGQPGRGGELVGAR